MSSRKSSSKSDSKYCSKSKKCEPCERLRLDVRHTLQRSFRDSQGFYHYVVQVVLTNNSDSDIKRLSLQENLLVGGSVVINGPIRVKGDEHVVPRGVNTPNEEWLATGELLKRGSKLKACRSATVVYELLYISLDSSGSLSSSIDVSGVVGCDRPQSIHSDLELVPPPTSLSPRVLSEPVCVNWRGQDIGDNTLIKEVSIDGILYEVRIVNWMPRVGFPRQYIAGTLVVHENLHVITGLATGPGGRAPIVIDPLGGMFTSPLSLSFSPDDEQAFRGIEFCFQPVWSFSNPGIFAGVLVPLVNNDGVPSIVGSDGTEVGSRIPKVATGAVPSGAPWTIEDTGLSNVMVLSSAAKVAGRLAFLYGQGTELRYAREDPLSPSGWTTNLIADPGGSGSLIDFNGLPVVFFNDRTNDIVKFAIASDVAGSSWTITTVSAGVRAPLGKIIIAEVAGLPVVAYVNLLDNDTVYYAYPSDASGSSWTNVPVVSNVLNTSLNGLGLIDAGGVPAVAYFSPQTPTLYYGRASDFMGSSWSQEEVISNPGILAFSLKLINGLPTIACSISTSTGAFLIYNTSNSVTGLAWTTSIITQSNNVTNFQGVFLEEIAGNAGIAYRLDLGTVRYAYRLIQ